MENRIASGRAPAPKWHAKETLRTPERSGSPAGTLLFRQGISFAVQEGEILGMLGPNGAGKTTTIRMITGFLPPTSGRVTVAGKDLFESSREARRQLGYLPETVSLYPEMRVDEYLA